MRVFVTQSKTATTTPYFPKRGIASHTGRLDVIARMLRASLRVEDGIRDDTTFIATLEGPPKPPLTLVFKGKDLECELADERDAVECIRACMKGELNGCEKRAVGLDEVVKGLGVPLFLLAEDGEDISRVEIPKSVAFLLGSQHDLELDPKILNEVRRVSIGPKSYLASHCISFIHYVMDLRFSTDSRPRRRPN